MTTSPIKIASKPGIKRDGTLLEGGYYVDGQWCRFHRGLPRKMRGYHRTSQTLTEKVYGMHSFASNGSEYIHMGSASKCLQNTLDYSGTLLTTSDRTPVAGFTSNSNNMWMFEILYDSVSSQNRLIAYAGQNMSVIDSTTASNIFYGDVTATSVLTDTGVTGVAGGIGVLAPYLVKFGTAGLFEWSVPNKPNDFTTTGAGNAGAARITGSKLVRCLPLRGGGSGPAGLIWSLDSLIRANFTGGATTWAFDTLSTNVSVLSPYGIIEVDGIYYWAGADRFQMFSGVVQELPNQMNLDWFYDNINMQYRQKVFAFKVPRFGEIWWCYPRGSATECTHAVIFNYREGTWYDTQLPNSGRSSASFSQGYQHLFATGVDLTSTNTYRLWQHEDTQFNEIDGSSTNPINSYFETNEITMLESQTAVSQTLRVARVEPDFDQTGNMTLVVKGRANARATDISSDTFTFPDYNTVPSPDQQTVPLKDARRLLRFRFGSNVQDGNYVMGDCYAHIEPSDGRITD